MTRRWQTNIFMFLKRRELLDLGHDEPYASWLYMVIQFVCPLSLYWICWALVGHWSHDYKSWVNSERQNAITNPENYWGSTTRPCVIGVWCSTESGDMSWLQNPFFESVKHFSTRSRMNDLCLYMCVCRAVLLHQTEANTISHILLHNNKRHEWKGQDWCRYAMCSMNVFKVSVMPRLMFCNFTAQGVQTRWE